MEAQVRDRLIALFKAMGERYNSHPNFEGISMIETAMGNPKEPLSIAQVAEFYNNKIIVHQQMRLFFPNTMTIQEVKLSAFNPRIIRGQSQRYRDGIE